MKISIINLNLYRYFKKNDTKPLGGTEIKLYILLNTLSKNPKYKISLISGYDETPREHTINNIKIYESVSLTKNIINYALAPLKLYQAIKKSDADVYIASAAGAEIGLARIFTKLLGKKFIYYTASEIDCNRKFIKNHGIIGWLFKHGLENADLVVTQNRNNQALLKKYHNIKATLIKNSFPLDPNKQVTKSNYLFWAARLEPNKNPEAFLKIAKALPKQRFIMVGNKQAHQKSYFNKIHEQIKKVKNIEFIERIPFQEIQKYYDQALLFLCTSDYEGFPNTHLQACRGKTPVISLNVNPDRYITKNNLGSSAKGNLNQMIKDITTILKSPEKYREKAKNAFKYVLDNHDIKKNIKEWEKVLDAMES